MNKKMQAQVKKLFSPGNEDTLLERLKQESLELNINNAVYLYELVLVEAVERKYPVSIISDLISLIHEYGEEVSCYGQ